MREEQAYAMVVDLADRCKDSIGPYVGEPTLESVRYDATVGFTVLLSFPTIMDYIPKLYLMLSGSVSNELLLPNRVEFCTILDKKVPARLALSRTPGNLPWTINPLAMLLWYDQRYHYLLQQFPEEHPTRTTLRFYGEAFSHGDEAYVGIAAYVRLSRTGKTTKLRTTSGSIRFKSYKVPSFAFEIFGRIAYYTNYLRYGRRSSSGLKKTELFIPKILDALKRGSGEE